MFIYIYIFFCVGASWWSVCYQRGLPLLVNINCVTNSVIAVFLTIDLLQSMYSIRNNLVCVEL